MLVHLGYSQNSIQEKIDWNTFISKQNLTFNKLPKKWQEAPYFGNGFIGSMVYQDTTATNVIKIQVFRTDVHDHRGDNAGWTAYSRPRLLIGYFTIAFKSAIISAAIKQHLYSADLNATIKTAEGTINLHHFISTSKDVIFTKINCSEKESYTLKWHPAEAKSTRNYLFPDKENIISNYAEAYGSKYDTLLKVYQPNPTPVFLKKDNVHLSVQNLLANGQYVVAWKQNKISESENVLSITIQNSYPEKTAENAAFKIISETTSEDYVTQFEQSKKWWSDFYKRSFVSIPDKKLEALYWLQLYKIGASNRANGPMMDTSGPWFQKTTWPYITWDLNVQLCYWPLNTSNHLDLAANLSNVLQQNTQQLIENVKPVEWQKDAAYIALATAQDLKGSKDDDQRYKNLHSNLSWTMHNVWLQYKYSMDTDFLREKCYPLLKRSVNYYLHIIEKEADGKYHIPMGYSPEYPEKAFGQAGESKDTNIDLALLKWNLGALLEASNTLRIDSGKRTIWQEVLQNIADYPIDENGFMVGADLPFTVSHRHYSHLLMMYPLYLVNLDNEPNKPLLEKSLKHWIGNPKKLAGYSYTGASSLSSALGNGNDALHYLKGLTRFLTPNGLYQEGGRPVLETPLSAAQSIHDMLLQSWENKIRFLPALPDLWKEVTFHNWLTEGAFEVSAVYKNGATDFITIKSLAGSKCTFVSTINNPKGFINNKEITLIKIAENTYQLNLKKGEIVLIERENYKGDYSINEVKKETYEN
jgi:hypothetical protein